MSTFEILNLSIKHLNILVVKLTLGALVIDCDVAGRVK